MQFAGMDSDLEQTQSLLIISSNLKKHSVEVATASASKAQKIQLDIQQACRLFLSMFLALMETSVVASWTEQK